MCAEAHYLTHFRCLEQTTMGGRHQTWSTEGLIVFFFPFFFPQKSVYNGRTNALTNSSSEKRTPSGNTLTLFADFLCVFSSPYEEVFFFSKTPFCPAIWRRAIRCRADVWWMLLAADVMLTYRRTAGWDKADIATQTAIRLQGKDINNIRGLGGNCLVVSFWDPEIPLSLSLFFLWGQNWIELVMSRFYS